jgi:formylglycine-generating enzyme required for sulfatase activity
MRRHLCGICGLTAVLCCLPAGIAGPKDGRSEPPARTGTVILRGKPARCTVRISGGDLKKQQQIQRALHVENIPVGRYSIDFVLGDKTLRTAIQLIAGGHIEVCGDFEANKIDIRTELHLDLGGGVKMRMLQVPSGSVQIGSPLDQRGREQDETPHSIHFRKPFFMGATEVTRGQFAAFVRATGYRTEAERRGWAHGWHDGAWGRAKGLTWRKCGFPQSDLHPVVCVTWNDAKAFCEWLSREDGRTVALPTERQWEYACRAGAKTAFHWGDGPQDAKRRCNVADRTAAGRFAGWATFPLTDGHVFTAPVGGFRPNAWGLHDMHGNVFEWCRDRYAPYPTRELPTPKAEPNAGVVRGGAFDSFPALCRCASRRRRALHTASHCIGFRVVME